MPHCPDGCREGYWNSLQQGGTNFQTAMNLKETKYTAKVTFRDGREDFVTIFLPEDKPFDRSVIAFIRNMFPADSIAKINLHL